MKKEQKNIDEQYMQRCLDLAQLGIQGAAPNPMVGCVIVHEEKIIGEGYHKKCGEAHAEVNAINSVIDKNLLSQSTLYVNLEPCSHYGKTPPCSLLIVKHKVKRVVVGCIDPFAKVSGRGIKIMKEGGVDVTVGILKKESLQLNKRFITFHEKKRPYIILKWAESADGFIDTENDAPAWLTNEASRILVHKMRAEEAAIMIGTNTAVKDNPSLTTRTWEGRNPVRIALDRELRIPQKHHLFDKQATTIIFTEKKEKTIENIEYVTIDFKADVPEQCLAYLHKKQLTSLIVEGGKMLLESFIEKNLWDEAWQFIGTDLLKSGVKAPLLKNATPESALNIEDVKLNVYHKK